MGYCNETYPAHLHVDSRRDSRRTIGAHLWACAGDASVREMLAGTTVEALAQSTAAFLCSTDNDGGLIVIDFDDDELDMAECLAEFLKFTNENAA